MGTIKTRQIKINWLRNTISAFFTQNPKETISKNKLLSQFCLSNATTRRTGEELLSMMEDTEQIKIDGDLISMGSR
jgi:hypothetical protein